MNIDYPYIIFILILIGFTINSFYGNDSKMFKYSSILVFLFLGLRAPIVGADTWNYYCYLTGERSFYNYDSRALEPLFLAYASLIRNTLSGCGQLIMLLNTYLSFIMWYILIKQNTRYKTLCILLFFLIGPWVNYFIALRQILGITILLYGIYCVIRKKRLCWYIYFICSILGWMMHTSVIIAAAGFLIMYYTPLISRTKAIGAIITTAVIGIVLQSFDIDRAFSTLSIYSIFFTHRLEIYLEAVKYADTDKNSLLIMLRQSILAIIAFLFLSKSQVEHWFSKIYLMGVCINNMFFSVILIGRLLIPFAAFEMIILSWAIYNIFHLKSPNMRFAMRYLVLFVFLYLTRSFIITNMTYDKFSDAKMHTYQFFFEDYSKNPIFKHPDIQRH